VSVGPDSYYDPQKEAKRWLHGPTAFGQGSDRGRMKNEFESIVTKREYFKTPKDRLTDHKKGEQEVGKIVREMRALNDGFHSFDANLTGMVRCNDLAMVIASLRR
jgi:hypothetical protein